jgi:hypothetical protein
MKQQNMPLVSIVKTTRFDPGEHYGGNACPSFPWNYFHISCECETSSALSEEPLRRNGMSFSVNIKNIREYQLGIHFF